MMPLKTTPTTTTSTSTLRQEKNQQQQNTKEGDMTVVGIKALDDHIERLEAKLSFLIRL